MQRTRHMLVYMMGMLLVIFEKEPDFKLFHLDSQTIPLLNYFEIRPEKKEAVRTMIDRINRPDIPARHIMVKADLVIRDSCGSHLKKETR